MKKTKFQSGDVLLIVDPQIDFFPNGALGVPEGDKIIPIVNKWIKAATEAGIPIIVSRDWHPAEHVSFKHRGGQWPVHCVQNTKGAEFHPAIHFPKDIIIINKATEKDKEEYSAFEGVTHLENKPLTKKLQELKAKRLWILGLALDYCVKYSTIDAHKYGFKALVVLPGTRGITKETGQEAMKSMREVDVIFETDEEPYKE